ncbi:MAG: DNA topoisomerase IV, partial [Pseudoclavibacter sp.]
KVSDYAEFPGKGRATGGVRAHRFTRGEDRLRLAWVGAEPRATAGDGAVRELPEGGAKRDGSGTALESNLDALGGSIGDETVLGAQADADGAADVEVAAGDD